MQTRIQSFIEVLITLSIKFVTAMLVWEFVIEPIFQYEANLGQNFVITSIFTLVSLILSYSVRRFFNWLHG